MNRQTPRRQRVPARRIERSKPRMRVPLRRAQISKLCDRVHQIVARLLIGRHHCPVHCRFRLYRGRAHGAGRANAIRERRYNPCDSLVRNSQMFQRHPHRPKSAAILQATHSVDQDPFARARRIATVHHLANGLALALELRGKRLPIAAPSFQSKKNSRHEKFNLRQPRSRRRQFRLHVVIHLVRQHKKSNRTEKETAR
jgi:hypothetical protein